MHQGFGLVYSMAFPIPNNGTNKKANNPSPTTIPATKARTYPKYTNTPTPIAIDQTTPLYPNISLANLVTK